MNLEATISRSPNDPKNLAGIELVEVRRTTGGGKSSTDAVSKRPDIHGRMNWLLGRIAQLEKTRAELIAARRENDDDPDSHARRIIDAIAAMNEVEFGEYFDDAENDEERTKVLGKAYRRVTRKGSGEG
jgi:hypothetical protein